MKCYGGHALLVCLGCIVSDRCQNLNSKGGDSEQNIPGVVEGITRKGKSYRRDHTRSNVCDQPGGLSLLRLLVPSVQFLHNVPLHKIGV